MALINCPECGKEISDKAKCCIHCGYPLSEIENTDNTNVCYNKNYSVKLESSGKSTVKVMIALKDSLDLSLTEAKEIIDDLSFIKTNIPLEEANNLKTKIEAAGGKVVIFDQDQMLTYQPSQENNITRCPRCGGTAFTPLKKKFSILTGFATNKVDLVCNNCGKIVKPK